MFFHQEKCIGLLIHGIINGTLLSMKRGLYIEKIEKWNCSQRRKPLILEGARQVGKTWLMQEFAKTHYENVVYARFDKNRTLRSVFDQDFDIDRIVESLEIL